MSRLAHRDRFRSSSWATRSLAGVAAASLLAVSGLAGQTRPAGSGLVSTDPSAGSVPDFATGTVFKSLSYHDVRNEVRAGYDADRYAVSTSRLIEHFEWLKDNGYTPVSVDDILAAQRGDKPLPDGAILLTFDDGLRSVYTRVFPLLKLYAYPAVVAVVGAWMDAPPDWSMVYDGIGTVTREDFVSWDELREMQASALVEVATHTWDLHRGIQGNPFGNQQPAAVTRLYDPDTDSYESDVDYWSRVESDLARARRRMREELGREPRVIVWPYGRRSELVDDIAAELGMSVSFGLRPGAQPVDRLVGVRRYVVDANSEIADFSWFLERSETAVVAERVVHVDLDYVYDPDPTQAESNLDALLERIHALQPTTVYLQAFADPDGDGTASELYFPNRHLPMRADLFNRVAWQLATRVDVDVYAWLPVLSFDLPDAELNDALSVKRWEGDQAIPSRPDYRRLSPWEPRAREIIGDIYEDLGKAAAFAGLLFHDDGYLNHLEDAAAYPREPLRLPSAQEKTLALVDFTDELAARVRRYRPSIKTARNLYAEVALEPHAEAWWAQSLPVFLERYDWTAVMAMPHMEGADDPEAWLDRLVRRVARVRGGLDRTVFELQSVDWRSSRSVDSNRLASWMRRLERQGAIHFGYYPDDFVRELPRLDAIRTAFSTGRQPWTGR